MRYINRTALKTSTLLIATYIAGVFTYTMASSGDAWLEFAEDVKTKCLDEASRTISNSADITYFKADPYGSESLGYGLLVGTSKHSNTAVAYICAYHKQSMTIELSTEFDLSGN